MWRILDYLGGSPHTDDPAEIDQLYQTVIDRRSAILIATLCVWIAAALAIYRTNVLWPLLWMASEAAITWIRWELLKRSDTASPIQRTIFRRWLNLLTLVWSAMFGAGNFGLLGLGHPDLTIIAAVFTSTIISVFSFRNAASPRIANGAIFLTGALFLLGLATSVSGLAWAAAAISIPWLSGLMLMTGQSHLLLVRLIRAERLANRLANTDPLTGLSNRTHFESHIRNDGSSQQMAEFALLSIDLDRFKQVNDQYGHAAGDHVLREAAHRLKTSVRSNDIVFRLGGDEFAIYLPLADCSDCESVSRRLIHEMSKPFTLSTGDQVGIGASVGSACSSEVGGGTRALLNAADAALYQAKRQGRNRHVHASQQGANGTPSVDA